MQALTEETGLQMLRELRIVKELLRKEQRWVKASVIVKLTGWKKGKMFLARRNGEVVFKRTKTGLWYDANSLAPAHLKIKAA